jgi:hypothetical protein
LYCGHCRWFCHVHHSNSHWVSSQSAEVGTAWQGRPWPGGQWITQGFWQGFEGGPCTHHGNGVWFPSMAYLHLWGQCVFLYYSCAESHHWVFFVCVWARSCYVAQPGLEFEISCLSLLSAGITCMSHQLLFVGVMLGIELRVSEMLCKHWPTELHYQSHTEFWIFPERNPLDHSVLSLSIAGFNLLIISEDFLVYVFL